MIHLKLGSRGHKARAWQLYLGHKSTSGYFGTKLEAATKAWQDDHALFSDGIVGPLTLAAAVEDGFEGFNPNGLGQAPAPPDATALAADAGIPVAILEALREVESSGEPNSLRFEPHIFIRLRPDLEKQIPYTRGRVVWSVVGKETDRKAFAVAFALAPAEAIRSTSWGSFQVMGSHLLSLHDGNPEDALASFALDPEGTSAALLARWFKHNQRARRAANSTPPNFAALALAYNGASYAKHKYHLRLAKAWRRHV